MGAHFRWLYLVGLALTFLSFHGYTMETNLSSTVQEPPHSSAQNQETQRDALIQEFMGHFDKFITYARISFLEEWKLVRAPVQYQGVVYPPSDQSFSLKINEKALRAFFERPYREKFADWPLGKLEKLVKWAPTGFANHSPFTEEPTFLTFCNNTNETLYQKVAESFLDFLEPSPDNT